MEEKVETVDAVSPLEVKPKKERTEKQILSFEKARMVLMEKQRAKLDAELNSVKTKLSSGKKSKKPIVSKLLSDKQSDKQIEEPIINEVKTKKKLKIVEPPSDSSSDEEEEIIVQKPKRAPKEPQNEIIEPKTSRKSRVKTNETPMNSPVEPTNRNPYSAMLSKYRY